MLHFDILVRHHLVGNLFSAELLRDGRFGCHFICTAYNLEDMASTLLCGIYASDDFVLVELKKRCDRVVVELWMPFLLRRVGE